MFRLVQLRTENGENGSYSTESLYWTHLLGSEVDSQQEDFTKDQRLSLTLFCLQPHAKMMLEFYAALEWFAGTSSVSLYSSGVVQSLHVPDINSSYEALRSHRKLLFSSHPSGESCLQFLMTETFLLKTPV